MGEEEKDGGESIPTSPGGISPSASPVTPLPQSKESAKVVSFFDNLVRSKKREEISDQDRQQAFETFDSDQDGLLSVPEFVQMCRSLFRSAEGEFYLLDAKEVTGIFALFDENKDGYVDTEEYGFCWNKWIVPVCYPRSAFLVIDVQNDFITGTLAIINCPAKHKGEDVVPVVNKLLATVPWNHVVYSLDWHPADHVSFIDNVHMRDLHPSCKVTAKDAVVYDTVVFAGPPPMEQKLWPRHCVQKSWGSEIHEGVNIVEGATFIHKGTNPEIDSYSAFWDNNKLSETDLNQKLLERGITDVYCSGIAYDVCVGATAKHAVEHMYRTVLVDDACRGILDEDIKGTQKYIRDRNGLVVHSSKVLDMVLGFDRNPVLGYAAASKLRSLKSRSSAAVK
ncbi:unnamed protein product [Cyprideis torosa]|uniref:nicotinamidase n=1 Tax=Cyprideis torosa TaxID=163714 RepID=A0A7R8W6H1_9CRUS|nr:unnamed protein product [Cyprideis torosa]CAG0885221.1 unnamed protein product [Cyprideis torosa]